MATKKRVGRNKGKKYRRHTEVMKDVLTAIKTSGDMGLYRTHIMNNAHMSYPMVVRYMKEAKRHGWIQSVETGRWIITASGTHALTHVSNLEDVSING